MSALDGFIYESAIKDAVGQIAAVVADMETGEILFANNPLEAMFGYSYDELMGKLVDVLLPVTLQNAHAHHRQDYARDPRPRQMGTGMVLRGLRKDGSEFPIQVGLVNTKVLEKSVAVAFVIDLTESVKTAKLIQETEGSK